jgi:hypothetical protein
MDDKIFQADYSHVRAMGDAYIASYPRRIVQ